VKVAKYGLRDVMEKAIDATYENGVFKPKEPVDLEEKSEVRLHIESAPKTSDDDDDPTGGKAARRFIGFIKNELRDVPVARDHDKYLDK
jgi:predicted DNA-binding antitoxin AbrB/MazE fold protein